jgi:transposase
MFTSQEPLRLQAGERESLQAVVRSTRSPAGWARRAQVLLLLDEGVSVRGVKARTGMSPRRIGCWKKRWQQQGLEGLLDAPRPGRPKKLTVEKEAAILAATRSAPTKPVTHWSTRRLARRVGLSHVTVMRVWHKAGLQPHRLQRYLASPDPGFEAKAKDLLGLYLNPPEKAVVFCVDEKTAIQALDRTQPALPLRSGKPERHSVEYVRHGTVSLLAALEVLRPARCRAAAWRVIPAKSSCAFWTKRWSADAANRST